MKYNILNDMVLKNIRLKGRKGIGLKLKDDAIISSEK